MLCRWKPLALPLPARLTALHIVRSVPKDGHRSPPRLPGISWALCHVSRLICHISRVLADKLFCSEKQSDVLSYEPRFAHERPHAWHHVHSAAFDAPPALCFGVVRWCSPSILTTISDQTLHTRTRPKPESREELTNLMNIILVGTALLCPHCAKTTMVLLVRSLGSSSDIDGLSEDGFTR